MRQYEWRGYNLLRQYRCGKIMAKNAKQARYLLLEQQIKPLSVRRNWNLSFTLNQQNLFDTLFQLSLLLQARIPLKEALVLIQHNTEQPKLYHWLNHLTQQLEQGFSFYHILQQSPLFLTQQDLQLIQVGELTGDLAYVIEQICILKKQQLELARKIQKIVFYPLLVLILSMGICWLLLIFIVPEFAQLYQNNQANLPLFTQILLSLSTFLQNYTGLIFILLVLILFLFKHRQFKRIRFYVQQCQWAYSLPIIGKTKQLFLLVQFSQNLSLLLQAGIPLNQAIRSFLPNTQTQSLSLFQHKLAKTLNLVEQGNPLSMSLDGYFFPTQIQNMIKIGEASGHLTHMLTQIAHTYQQQLDHKIELASQLIEPFLMLIIGGVIGVIMLGLYLPIFNMGSVLL